MDSTLFYEMLEEAGAAYSTGDIVYSVVVNLLSILGYVLAACGMYSIAKRRGIANPWLAWVPIAQFWVMGSISDQFRYVTKAQVKNKRTTLLVLAILQVVTAIAVVIIGVVSVLQMSETGMNLTEEQAIMQMMTLGFKILGGILVVCGIALAFQIVSYIALYDIYMSVNPGNAVLFIVLSILFNVTQAFFIFFNRNKDGGMPPRCDVPQAPVNYSYIPETAAQEPVETVEEPVEETEEEAPAEEPEAPAEETEAPAEQTEVPAEKTEEPAEQTEVPAEETEEPAQQTEE